MDYVRYKLLIILLKILYTLNNIIVTLPYWYIHTHTHTHTHTGTDIHTFIQCWLSLLVMCPLLK